MNFLAVVRAQSTLIFRCIALTYRGRLKANRFKVTDVTTETNYVAYMLKQNQEIMSSIFCMLEYIGNFLQNPFSTQDTTLKCILNSIPLQADLSTFPPQNTIQFVKSLLNWKHFFDPQFNSITQTNIADGLDAEVMYCHLSEHRVQLIRYLCYKMKYEHINRLHILVIQIQLVT